jgi:hypothetical protein
MIFVVKQKLLIKGFSLGVSGAKALITQEGE